MAKSVATVRTRGVMTRNKAIVKFCVILLLVGLGLFLTFGSFRIPFTSTTYRGFWGGIQQRMGIDLQGGVLAIFEAEGNPSASQMRATVQRLENMLAGRGLTEANVMRQGSNQIRIEAPGMHDTQELLQVIGEPAELDFRRSPNESDILFVVEGTSHISRVSIAQPQLGEFGVRIHFTNRGGELFRDAVRTVGENNSLYIFANGRQISNPVIRDVNVGVDNTATISSPEFRTQAAAQHLRTQIESGLFAVNLELSESSIISATLGEGALMAGVIAFIVAIVFMFLFMFLIYGDLGLLSNLSILVYAILFMGALAITPIVQLTLPGIAGIILALAMAVDANIIIFERVKDEYKSGKRMGIAVESGFKKSFWTIFDANITTIIAAGVLYLLGTGPIQGFAIVLLLGVVISMFCSLFVTRQFAKLYLYINPNNAKRLRLKQQQTLEGGDAEIIEGKGRVISSKKPKRKLNLGGTQLA
ncbi:MAG: SecD/SecF family protein translocase subunit [Firmicutes bacterium]|nr:SecD/SecF family protein translocase subunit [Bacillota bacterium]